MCRIEVFYCVFGDDELIVISDAPDQAGMMAVSLTIDTSGAGSIKSTVAVAPGIR